MTRTAVRAAAAAGLLIQSAGLALGQPTQPTPAALVRTADVVLTGSVTAITAAGDRGTLPIFVTLAVADVFKGWIPERAIVIKQADPAVPFRIGESLLLFLAIDGGDRTLVPLASSGIWIVTADARTGEPVARPAAPTTRLAPFGRAEAALRLADLRDAAAASRPALVEMSRIAIDVHPRIAHVLATTNAADEALPGPPRQLSASVINGAASAAVGLFWLPPAAGGTPASYRVDAGSAPGLSDIASVPVAAASLQAIVARGFVAFVRVYAVNAAGVSPPSNEVQVVAAVAPPGAPTALDGNIAHGFAKLMWVAPPFGRPVSYVVEAGSSSGARDIGTFETNSPDTFASGSLAPRLYFFRVRARNSAGLGPPSNEISFAAPGSLNCLPPEAAPGNLSASVSGATLTLSFSSGYVGGVSYVVEAGSTPGALDIATLDVGRDNPAVISGVPPGQYYLRLFTRSPQCGIGGTSSNEILVTVQ